MPQTDYPPASFIYFEGDFLPDPTFSPIQLGSGLQVVDVFSRWAAMCWKPQNRSPPTQDRYFLIEHLFIEMKPCARFIGMFVANGTLCAHEWLLSHQSV